VEADARHVPAFPFSQGVGATHLLLEEVGGRKVQEAVLWQKLHPPLQQRCRLGHAKLRARWVAPLLRLLGNRAEIGFGVVPYAERKIKVSGAEKTDWPKGL
jgi:hypothetical protein